MKYLFPLLLLFLLCGCAAQNPKPETIVSDVSQTQTEAESIPSQPESFYDPSSNVEMATNGAVRAYPLATNAAWGIHAAGDCVLVFSGDENTTTITQLSGEDLRIDVSFTINERLSLSNITLRENSLSYFSHAENRTVIMDIPLREIRSIDAPEGLLGTPRLSADGSTLYYCTASAVRGLDVDSRISRVVKEAAYPAQSIAGVLMADTVLQLSITDHDGTEKSLFLSTQTGRLLGESEGSPQVMTSETGFFTYRSGATILCGQAGESPRLFLPRMQKGECFFLPECGAAVASARTGTAETTLESYDLVSGQRTASVTLPEDLTPLALTRDSRDSIWFLADSPDYGCQTLYRWDPGQSAADDSAIYTTGYYTETNPDYDGLAACTLYAREIGETYGIEVLIYKDAVALQPWDYELEYEYQSAVLMRELELLDQRLRNFPEGFLRTLAETFTALKICIVRQAVGTADAGSLESVDGIQFFDNTDAYIVLAAGKDTESALYHEMSHLLESMVMTHSTAYDRWEKLNPPAFSYDMDYIANQNRDGSPWLEPGREYFIDTYSMSFPKEDRARILESAMTEGNAGKFASPHLQAKLQKISTGIREAFRLEDSPEVFLWEQYLAKSPK